MSWFISHIGTRAVVKEKVLANTSLPSSVKDAILIVLDDAKPDLGIRIEGFGHENNGTAHTHYSHLKLEIQPIHLDV